MDDRKKGYRTPNEFRKDYIMALSRIRPVLAEIVDSLSEKEKTELLKEARPEKML